MMSYDNGFPEYVPVAEKRAKNQQSLTKLQKKNPNLNPIIINGSKIAKTWWGKAWNDNLERYSDYANRIGRGRSYVRYGAVLDLQITAGEISALVQGSRAKPYEVTITIKPLAKDVWGNMINTCEGQLDSLQELLAGKFPKKLAEVFTTQGQGLFPSPKEIALDCTCPDWATMCKHVAAVLYGVGARFDDDPALFFVLREVNVDDLISKALAQKSQKLLQKTAGKSSRIIDDIDVAVMFGIDVAAGPENSAKKSPPQKTLGKGKTVKSKTKK